MEGTPAMAQIPKDKRALIAIDLGAAGFRFCVGKKTTR